MMILYISIVLLLILATRVLAYWGICMLSNAELTVIPGILNFTFVKNFGAGFGIFQGAKTALVAVSVVIFIFITFYVAQKKNQLKLSTLIPLALVAGGGISNVADRLQFGYVVDYINVHCINYPVFNFADICVVIGVFWIAAKIVFAKEVKEVKEAKEAKEVE